MCEMTMKTNVLWRRRRNDNEDNSNDNNDNEDNIISNETEDLLVMTINGY